MSRIALNKPKKGVPTHYVAWPQPPDLNDPWELVLAVPDVGKKKDYHALKGVGAVFLYFNSADHTIQFSDPRPQTVAEEDRLPAGWEQLFDDEGDPYYVNVDSGVKSYDDPRAVVRPLPSKSLMVEETAKKPMLRAAGGDEPKMKMKRDSNYRPSSVAIYEERGGELPQVAAEYNPFSTGADAPLPIPPPGRPAATKPAAPSDDDRKKPTRSTAGSSIKKVKEEKADPNAIWQIGECDLFKYEMLDDCLTFEDEIPVPVRNKVHNRYMDILPNPKTRVPLPAIAGIPVRLPQRAPFPASVTSMLPLRLRCLTPPCTIRCPDHIYVGAVVAGMPRNPTTSTPTMSLGLTATQNTTLLPWDRIRRRSTTSGGCCGKKSHS